MKKIYRQEPTIYIGIYRRLLPVLPIMQLQPAALEDPVFEDLAASEDSALDFSTRNGLKRGQILAEK